MRINSLNQEELIVLHASKLILDEEDIFFLKKACSNPDIDWMKVFTIVSHHKVIALFFHTLKTYGLLQGIDLNVSQLLEVYANHLKFRNNVIFNEIEKCHNAFLQNNLRIVLLKGGALSTSVYKNLSLRYFSDIDYLIDEKDIVSVKSILESLGYVQGVYNQTEQIIEPFDRSTLIYNRMHTHELGNFVKLLDSSYCSHMEIDINFDVSWKGANRKFSIPVPQFLENSLLSDIGKSQIYSSNNEYLLIHLCCHLYSEAMFFCFNSIWRRSKRELCLYRFCDFQALIKTKEIKWDVFIKYVKEYGVDEPVYFSLKLSSILYPHLIPQKIFSEFSVDESILDVFYDKKGNICEWDTPFLERLFNVPKKYLEIMEKGIF